jgi:uncharacterized protein (TIGR00369 family)
MAEALRAPKTPKHLEELRAWLRGATSPAPIAQLLGLRPLEFSLGQSKFEFAPSRQHANPMGTLHGGVLCDLADLAMGTAMVSTLEAEESFTTLDMTAKFLKPVWEEQLTAVAHVTKRTRMMGFIECEVKDATGSLVAKVFSTCLVLSGEKAEGRRPGDAVKA